MPPPGPAGVNPIEGIFVMRYLLLALFLTIPGLAAAQSVQDQIVSQLTAQGFTRIEVSRTLLGRVKIEARSPSLERELVFNPVTGEILRDYWQDRDDGESATPRVLIPRAGDDDDGRGTVASSSGSSSNSGNGGSGGSGGSGSSGSGSGSSGGSGHDDDRADDDRSGRGGGDRSESDDDRSDDDSGRGRGRGRGGDDGDDD